MEKSKRRQNFSSDEVEILVHGIEKNTKVRMFQGKLLLFSENVGAGGLSEIVFVPEKSGSVFAMKRCLVMI